VNPTVLPPGQGVGAGAGAGKGGFSLGELKGMIDRMGGIDGVINGVTKMQKFVGVMTQMAPLIRVFFGKGGKAKASAGTGTGSTVRRPSGNGSGKRRSGSGRRRSGKRRK
jgi:hypothetical protein